MSQELPRSHVDTYSGWWVVVWPWMAADLHHLLCQSLPFSAGEWGRSKMETSWVEIRTGRSLTNCHHRENRLSLGKTNLISYSLQKGRIARNKDKNETIFPSPLLLILFGICSAISHFFCPSSSLREVFISPEHLSPKVPPPQQCAQLSSGSWLEQAMSSTGKPWRLFTDTPLPALGHLYPPQLQNQAQLKCT